MLAVAAVLAWSAAQRWRHAAALAQREVELAEVAAGLRGAATAGDVLAAGAAWLQAGRRARIVQGEAGPVVTLAAESRP